MIKADLSGKAIGCPPLPQVICHLPKVTVDGAPIGIGAYLLGAAHEEPLDATEVQRAAIASAVKSALMEREARAQGLTVSDAEVQSEVQRNLALMNESTAQGHPPPALLLGGLTPQAYWSSPKAVENQRKLLLLGKEQLRIVSKPLDRPQLGQVLAEWLRTILPHHHVLIDGQPPAFSLADALIASANKPPPSPYR